jgi:hypothetical protein
MTQCRRGTDAFFAIVGWMTALPWALRHAIEIGSIAVKRICRRKRIRGLRRQIKRVARTQADDEKLSGHGRFSQPGTSTTAK